MKILIDIGHPAHVHLFRFFASEMVKRGHHVLFTTRDKEVTLQLLDAYNLQTISFGKHYTSKAGKIWGLLKFDTQMLKTALTFKPDIFLSHGSMYAAQVAWLLRKPHITFEDTGNMEQVRLYLPFSKTLLVSTAFHKELGKKQLRYPGYHELAYLHPAYYQPDDNIYATLNLKKKDPYIILRFVSWAASHDVGQAGLSDEIKSKIVAACSQHCTLFISSEGTLPSDLQKYRIRIAPEKMHDALAHAQMFIGEGATMASECAVLGTPAVYVNSITAGTLEEQEKYGLIYSFRNSSGVLDKVTELLHTPNLKATHQERRRHMLTEKINVTAFMCWFVENYPDSERTARTDPAYFDNFK